MHQLFFACSKKAKIVKDLSELRTFVIFVS